MVNNSVSVRRRAYGDWFRILCVCGTRPDTVKMAPVVLELLDHPRMNRRLTAVLADLHFAPTDTARDNLLAQGVKTEDIYVTGNTGIDALLKVASKEQTFDDPRVAKAAASGKMILVTAHRRENWGEPMSRICAAAQEILRRRPDHTVVFPMHKNPIVRETIVPALGGMDNVILVEPPDYASFVHLMKAARIILTDSGDVQEEAPSLGKPVLVLRETTERPEGVTGESSRLVGTSVEAVVGAVETLLSDTGEYSRMSEARNPYGDGRTAQRIWGIIKGRFEIK